MDPSPTACAVGQRTSPLRGLKRALACSCQQLENSSPYLNLKEVQLMRIRIMAVFVTLLVSGLLLIAPSLSFGSKPLAVSSPDGDIKVEVELKANPALSARRARLLSGFLQRDPGS